MMEENTKIEEDAMMEEENQVTFQLTGENFKFLLNGTKAPELRVKVGDKVRIEFTSTSGFHDWTIDEFSAATEQVSTGDSTSVEFTADQAGTFEYYCSVGNHRAQGMFGKLIVE
jgi:plastocyanin